MKRSIDASGKPLHPQRWCGRLLRAAALAVACAAVLACLASMAGCSADGSGQTGQPGSASARNEPVAVRIGTMPTEDLLPLFVAQQQGLFDGTGVDVQLVVFDSAQNLSAAITAGEVELAMTDPMRAARLFESGIDVSMEWITLGTDAAQGAFGVLAPADAPYDTLEQLAQHVDLADFVVGESGFGVGVASNTVPEYVFEQLCRQAGVDPQAIGSVEVPSLPDRYQMVATGNLPAAALPGSLLALGEASGLKVLADDTTGQNLSQSVMIARRSLLEVQSWADAIEQVRVVWDKAAEAINANPEAYRAVLIANANLNDAVADTYPISVYPLSRTADGASAHPPASLIDPQLQWMLQKGYLAQPLAYDEATGSFAKKAA